MVRFSFHRYARLHHALLRSSVPFACRQSTNRFSSSVPSSSPQVGKLPGISTGVSAANQASSGVTLGPQPVLTPTRAVALLGTGLLSGALGSLVGLGGAFIALPIMSGLLGMSPHYAIGTSMASVLAVAVGAAIGYSDKKPQGTSAIGSNNEDIDRSAGQSEIMEISTIDSSSTSTEAGEVIFGTSIPRRIGSVDVQACMGIVSTALIFSPLGARASKRVQAGTIKLAQGVLLMCVAPSIIARDILVKSAETNSSTSTSIDIAQSSNADEDKLAAVSNEKPNYSSTVSEVAKFAGIGVFSGFTAGFFGVGGGAIVVPSLVWLAGADYRTALGTSMAAMIPTSFSGAAMHFAQKTMVVSHALPLLSGSLVGSFVGGKISSSINETLLKQLFSATIFAMGLKTFLSALKRV